MDGEKRYILAPDGLKAGEKVVSGPDSAANVGNCLPMSKIPLGTDIHNIELLPGRGGACCVARPAPVPRWPPAMPIGPRLTCPAARFAGFRRPAGQRWARSGNSDHMGIVIGKAGRNRWLGRRPHVRGTAMNPVDHPHGGGEGRTKGGRHPVSPTGQPAKGGSTRKKRKPSNRAIVRRRRSRRYGQLKL